MMLLYAQLLILALLATLNIWFGIEKGVYDTLWWWDIPTHFLGGVWLGIFTAWFLQTRDKKFSVLQCALMAFSVGVCWEIFEYYADIAGSGWMSYWMDTLKDIVVDVSGGAIAGLAILAQKALWRK